MPSLKLVWRNLTRRPLRSILTVLSLTVAIFLVCGLRSLLTTMTAGIEHADSHRLAVMSSTGLFVELPESYQEKIDRVPGVARTTKFQWFGGYYRTLRNFFGQFAVDPEAMLEMYPECQVDAEARERFLADQTSCILGWELARDFGFEVGDTVPLIGDLHPHPRDQAWEFRVAGIYRSKTPNFDNRTMFFHWKYYEETLESAGVPTNVAVFAIRVAPGADVAAVIAGVEALFENGPQRVDCETEAEFQRQFITMIGNLPLFVGWIGTGVLIAILLACVNTMLMAMREQMAEIGIMKSLGFTDSSMFGLLIAQALALCCIGGGLGILGAAATESWIAEMLGQQFPNYHVVPRTYALAAVIAVGLGLVAGLVPAWRAARLRCIEALHAAE